MARIRFAGQQMGVPTSRPLRIAFGVALIIFGIFGFLPVLGFWMIPLGLVVLSADFHSVRRFRRKTEVGVGRWWQNTAPGNGGGKNGGNGARNGDETRRD